MQRYSDRLMDHFMNPRHSGVLRGASGWAEVKNPTCGDVTRIYVRIEKGIVINAGFLGAGCGPGIACASYLLECIVGSSLEDARAVGVNDIVRALQVPKMKRHAAELAVDALHAALEASNAAGDSKVSVSTLPTKERNSMIS